MYSSNENAFLKMKGQRANAPYALGHGDVNPTIPRTTITGTKGMRGTKDFALQDSKVPDGIDLAEQERVNRFKYGVKKPANIWGHEMDDARISGAQIRTNNFRGSMFTRDREAQIRYANKQKD